MGASMWWWNDLITISHTQFKHSVSPSLVSWVSGSCRAPPVSAGTILSPSAEFRSVCQLSSGSQLLDVSSAFPFLQSDPRAGRQTAGIREPCADVWRVGSAGAPEHTTVVPAPLTGPHWTGVTAVASQPHMWHQAQSPQWYFLLDIVKESEVKSSFDSTNSMRVR